MPYRALRNTCNLRCHKAKCDLTSSPATDLACNNKCIKGEYLGGRKLMKKINGSPAIYLFGWFSTIARYQKMMV